ncbi:hypothetical protein K466DRAFT_567295 [Polyporus arcularius HHB13444]|uniref:Uncharacterized protein n=1 Tax=Polyporus arcularius HHB13444 TaxID=1314778 RepID=A0A5C3P5M3_9APHY|nr:hypothetical protein K466DRAFT_567295 [Polyporus arcularius HHB13444]
MSQEDPEQATLASVLAERNQMREYIAMMHRVPPPESGLVPHPTRLTTHVTNGMNATPATIPEGPPPPSNTVTVPQVRAHDAPWFDNLTARFPQYDPNGKLILPRDPRNFPKAEYFPLLDVPFWFQTQVTEAQKNKGDETVPGENKGQRGSTRLVKNNDNVRFSFITDAYGVPVGGHIVAAMRTHTRDYFQKLWDEGRCPDTWFHGASSTIKQEFYAYMYDEHPELALCAFHYKAERLAILGLPGWLENKRFSSEQEPDDEELKAKRRLKLERKERYKAEKREKGKDKRQKKKESKCRKRNQPVAQDNVASSSNQADLNAALFRLSPSAHDDLYLDDPPLDLVPASKSESTTTPPTLLLVDDLSVTAATATTGTLGPALATEIVTRPSNATAYPLPPAPAVLHVPAQITSDPSLSLAPTPQQVECLPASTDPSTLDLAVAPPSLSSSGSGTTVVATGSVMVTSKSSAADVSNHQDIKDLGGARQLPPATCKPPHLLAGIYPPRPKYENAVSFPPPPPPVTHKKAPEPTSSNKGAPASSNGKAPRSRKKDPARPWPPPPHPKDKTKEIASRVWKVLNPEGDEDQYDEWYKEMKTHARRTKWLKDHKKIQDSLVAASKGPEVTSAEGTPCRPAEGTSSEGAAASG